MSQQARDRNGVGDYNKETGTKWRKEEEKSVNSFCACVWGAVVVPILVCMDIEGEKGLASPQQSPRKALASP